MPDAPKLSDLIEKGAAVCTPKRSYTLEFEDDQIFACPLGMAFVGSGAGARDMDEDAPLNSVLNYLYGLGIDTGHEIEHPLEEGKIMIISEAVIGLFDRREWSVSQIIAWLRSIGR